MAELIIKGYASKSLVCDTVQYSISFKKDGKSIPEAVSKLNKEVEGFLAVMEEKGIPASDFKMGNTSTREKYRSEEEEFPYEANRGIYLTVELNAATSNEFLRLIEKKELNINYSESYSHSDIPGLHKELLKLAMEDSKNKAEMLAECAGKKVIGIKKVDANFKEHEEMERDEAERGVHYMRKCGSSLADKLKSPTVEESEEIEVIWEIES